MGLVTGEGMKNHIPFFSCTAFQQNYQNLSFQSDHWDRKTRRERKRRERETVASPLDRWGGSGMEALA